jgi:hypothetical protein
MRGEVEEELYETWRVQLEKRGIFEMGDWKPIAFDEDYEVGLGFKGLGFKGVGFDEDYEVGLGFKGVGFGFGFAPTCMVILRR